MSFREIVDILGIVLPALILSVGFIRLFSQRNRGFYNIIMICATLLLIIGLIRYFLFPGGSTFHDTSEKLKAIHVSKHSETFNQSVENILTAYYKMTDAFARGDLGSINELTGNLRSSLDQFSLDELKPDTLIYETALQPFESAKAELNSLQSAATLEAKKISYKNLSDNLFNLVSIVHYDVTKLYWLECDKAFGENGPGEWLSPTEKSANPYGQQDCADVKTTINFVPADSTSQTK